jgi:hypothetical protein
MCEETLKAIPFYYACFWQTADAKAFAIRIYLNAGLW